MCAVASPVGDQRALETLNQYDCPGRPEECRFSHLIGSRISIADLRLDCGAIRIPEVEHGSLEAKRLRTGLDLGYCSECRP